MARARRIQILTDLLREGGAATQAQLASALADAGEPATQATISRDLRSIGAVRGPGGYALPGGPGGAVANMDDESVATSVRRHALSVSLAGSLVVIRTAPGHANVVAVDLDRRPPEHFVGCVAGDDTVMIAASGEGGARALHRRLLAMLDGARKEAG